MKALQRRKMQTLKAGRIQINELSSQADEKPHSQSLKSRKCTNNERGDCGKNMQKRANQLRAKRYDGMD